MENSHQLNGIGSTTFSRGTRHREYDTLTQGKAWLSIMVGRYRHWHQKSGNVWTWLMSCIESPPTLEDKTGARTLVCHFYYTKLYYGSEIWHILNLTLTQSKSLKFALANALKLCMNGNHRMSYWKKNLCEDKFVQLKFQLVGNERISKINFIKRQNYDVGKNILLRRMHTLNNKIDKNWLDLSLNSSWNVKIYSWKIINNLTWHIHNLTWH